MVVSGMLTTTMIYAAIAPEAAMQSTFGATLNDPVTMIVVRNRGVLIALVGAMLIDGAFNSVVRAWFWSSLESARPFLLSSCSHRDAVSRQWSGRGVAIDSIMIVLFAWYLLAASETSDAILTPK